MVRQVSPGSGMIMMMLLMMMMMMMLKQRQNLGVILYAVAQHCQALYRL